MLATHKSVFNKQPQRIPKSKFFFITKPSLFKKRPAETNNVLYAKPVISRVSASLPENYSSVTAVFRAPRRAKLPGDWCLCAYVQLAFSFQPTCYGLNCVSTAPYKEVAVEMPQCLQECDLIFESRVFVDDQVKTGSLGWTLN